MATIFSKVKSELQQTGTVLGGLLLAILVMLLVSGTILAFFYEPHSAQTYQGMVDIAGNPLLSFVRNFHFWSSDIFLFTLFLHMTRVALTKPSGKPRRYAWWIGLGLLIMVGAEMLLGTFLRGDQEAFEAYSHFFLGTTGIVARYVPFVTWITDFFSAPSALFRFFLVHAVVLPFTIMALIVLHGLFAPTFRALLAPWKKVTDATIRGSLRPVGFFSAPSVRKIAGLTLVALGIIIFLSVTVPAPLLARPYEGLEVTKPPWWLLWVVAAENVWGLTPIVVLPPLLFLVFAAVPLLTKDRPGADWGVYLYLLTVAALITVSFWAAFAPQVAHTEHFSEQQTAAH